MLGSVQQTPNCFHHFVQTMGSVIVVINLHKLFQLQEVQTRKLYDCRVFLEQFIII
jgi:hypothetical protein